MDSLFVSSTQKPAPDEIVFVSNMIGNIERTSLYGPSHVVMAVPCVYHFDALMAGSLHAPLYIIKDAVSASITKALNIEIHCNQSKKRIVLHKISLE